MRVGGGAELFPCPYPSKVHETKDWLSGLGSRGRLPNEPVSFNLYVRREPVRCLGNHYISNNEN